MISKRTRKSTGAVENLKIGSFAANKGIDEKGSVLSANTVIEMNNLDISDDGSLELRKPVIYSSHTPTINGARPDFQIPVLNDYTLYIFETAVPANTKICILHNETGEPQVITYTYTEALLNTNVTLTRSSDLGFSYGNKTFDKGIYSTSFFDFKNVSYASLNTSVLLYGTLIDYTNNIFVNNPLVNKTLYSSLWESNKVSWVNRALNIYKNNGNFIVQIYYTHPNSILNSSNELSLDINLYSDNPYAIRDSYKQSLTQVKGIQLYIPTSKIGNIITPTVTGTDAVVSSITQSLNTNLTFSNFTKNGLDKWSTLISNINSNSSVIENVLSEAPADNCLQLKINLPYDKTQYSGIDETVLKSIRSGTVSARTGFDRLTNSTDKDAWNIFNGMPYYDSTVDLPNWATVKGIIPKKNYINNENLLNQPPISAFLGENTNILNLTAEGILLQLGVDIDENVESPGFVLTDVMSSVVNHYIPPDDRADCTNVLLRLFTASLGLTNGGMWTWVEKNSDRPYAPFTTVTVRAEHRIKYGYSVVSLCRMHTVSTTTSSGDAGVSHTINRCTTFRFHAPIFEVFISNLQIQGLKNPTNVRFVKHSYF